MPIHLEDLDVVSETAGASSALLVPCYMCPAVTVAVREERPFIRLFRSFLKSAPFEEHIRGLQSRLEESGVRTEVFRSRLPHHWFQCMWGTGRREKLRKTAARYEAVIVLGCDTGTETVREAVASAGCKVVEGMRVTGFTNAKMRFRWPANVTFEDSMTVPIRSLREEHGETEVGEGDAE